MNIAANYLPHHYDLAILCDEAYDESPEIWSKSENDVLVKEYPLVVRLNCRGTQASKTIFHGNFSWDGITNVRDIAKDLLFFPYAMQKGEWVHMGFALSAIQWAEAYALRLAEIGKPVVLSGHSLGASMAALLAMILRRMGIPVIEVVLFGEPASFYFGSEKAYRALQIPTTSYLNENDWIRFAPPVGSTSVARTFLNRKPGISRSAHNIELYARALKPV